MDVGFYELDANATAGSAAVGAADGAPVSSPSLALGRPPPHASFTFKKPSETPAPHTSASFLSAASSSFSLSFSSAPKPRKPRRPPFFPMLTPVSA